MIEIGFITSMDELMLQARRQRTAVRRAARAELAASVSCMAAVLIRDIAAVLPAPLFRSAAAVK